MNNCYCDRKIKSQLYLNRFWLILFAVGIGVYVVGMPKCADDYWYMKSFAGWFLNQGVVNPDNGGDIFSAGIPWAEIKETWAYHYNEDNGRLCNIISPIILLFPKWVGSGLALIAFFAAVVRVLTYVGIDWQRSVLLPLCVFMLYFFLPWHDMMGSVVFQMNYLVSTYFSVELLLRMQRAETGKKGIVVVFLFALLTGFWHEGFSLPIFCAIIADICISRRVNRVKLVALIGLSIGLIYLFSAPGMVQRITWTTGRQRSFGSYEVVGICIKASVFFIYLAVVSTGLMIRSVRERMHGKKWLFYIFVMSLVAIALMIISNTEERAGWVFYFYSVAGITGMLQLMFPGLSCLSFRQSVLWGFVAMLPVCISLFLVGKDILRIRKESSRMVAYLHANRDVLFLFGKKKLIKDKPLIQIKLPEFEYDYRGLMYVKEYFERTENRIPFLVVPEELRCVTSETGNRVPGSGGYRNYKGYYFKEDSGSNLGFSSLLVSVDFGKGPVPLLCKSTGFRSEKDGKTYVYLEPEFDWYMTHFKTIRSIDAFME